MNWLDIFVWGLCATSAMTVIESAGLWFRLSRMSTPVLLGTMVTGDRDRATFLGTLMHLVLGWVFAIFYALAFTALGLNSWWIGMLLGIGQTLFMLGVMIPAIPAIHPRMASRREGPTPMTALQTPGFLALNYGRRTILVSMAAHAVYGALLGALYQIPA